MDIIDHHKIISGLKTYYRVCGDNSRPTILFLNGWGARKDGITVNLIKILSEKFFVISLELPGHIRSEPPPMMWGLKEYADFTKNFVNSLSIKTPFVLMGHSFGGGVTMFYAILYPNDLEMLILDASMQTPRPKIFHSILSWWSIIFKGIVRNRFLPIIFKKLVVSLFTGTPFDLLKKDNLSRYEVMGEILHRAEVQEGYGGYAKLTMPVLLMWGKKDTWISPIDRARKITQEIPRAKFVELNGGHLALFHDTQRALHEILQFYSSKR